MAWTGAALGEAFDLGFAWDATSRELTGRALDLANWQHVLPGLPLPAELRARLAATHPRGRIESLKLGWTGARPGADNFSVLARFSGLGINADGAIPGFDRLAGTIEGDARGGRFELDAHPLALDLPALFREPRIQVDELRARGGWSRTARGHLLRFDELAFANPDAAGTLKGSYEYVPGTRGRADLEARLTRADGTAVYRYLPRRIGDATVDWARQGVVAGRSDDVRFSLRGDLARFPFDRGDGAFRVEAKVKDATIRYVHDWPVIEDVDASLVFAGRAMQVNSTRARIYGVALAPVKVVIPDLLHHDELLQVDGQANGPVQDFIRFANFSPVGERLRGFTDALDGNGAMRLALSLRVPLRRSHDTTVAGRLSFLGDTLYSPSLPRIEQLRGDVEFTGNSLTASNIAAQFLGGPLRIDALTQNGEVRLLAQGRATAAGMAPWLGEALGARLSGQTLWHGQIDFEPGGERVRVESDLVGLGSSLPAPLGKPAAQALPLFASAQPLPDGRVHEVKLGRLVGAVWRDDDAGRFVRGEIRFGGSAVMPADPGLRLAGSGRGLDISGWMGLLPEREGGAQLSTIDLGFDSFDLMGRRFQDVRLQGRTRNGLLRTQVNGHEVSGTLTYRPAGAAQPARVSAQFRQLVIPDPAPAASGDDAQNMKASEFPVLDLVVDDFRLQDRPLGRLDVVARGAPQGLVIENLQLTHADSVFRMSGLWRDGGTGETRADLDLNVLDAGRFLARFGFPDTLKRGTAEISGNATWEGSPADFGFRTLAGQLDFKAKNGQFLKVEPGAGKLLGVLSLQSLPRRLNFDFRDIFNSGYAFDDMGATLRIARGVVYSDDFRMRGPAAKVNMSGLADLRQETVQLRVKVIPKLSEGVAVAGALLGGPIAGVGALAAQKILRDPVEEAISQEYMVTGPWLAPDVKRLSRTKAKQEPAEP
ncbi:MAG: TIGR02099 family protein [Thiobacillus sp.]|nr:TIGR02099 family protein [Thiobacillus sp.]